MDGTVGTVCTTINSVFQMYALMQGKKEARSDKLSEQINFLNRQIANATGQKKMNICSSTRNAVQGISDFRK